MTVGTPSWIAASGGSPTYDATELRLIDTVDLMWDGHVLGARPGVRPGGNPLSVTLGGSPLTWTVQPGVAVVTGLSLGALGAYRVPVLAAVSGTVPAADATWDRKDIIVVRVFDPEADGGTLRQASIEYLTGVPAATPSAPATPATSLLLATITIPKVGGPQPSVALNTVYTVAAGGILPTQARPSNAYPGLTIFRTDTGDRETWNGSTWLSEPLIRPTARIRQTTAQPFSNALFAVVNFDQINYDTAGMADLATDRLTASRPGVYTAVARVAFSANGAGYRRADLLLNGAIYAVDGTDANTTAGLATQIIITDSVRLNTGDYLQVRGFQTSGASLNSVASGDYYSTLSLVYESPLP